MLFRSAFSAQEETILRQFAAYTAIAIENARLFESEHHYIDTLETLAEIGREMSSILDLDILLTRIAGLTKRLIAYRTFGIFLLNEQTQVLEMKLAVRYGEEGTPKSVRLGEGLVGWSAQHKEPVLVADVSTDPRYLNLVPDAKSELVIPMLIKDRCIGVFDLESPELDAFTKEHKELLTLLASQAAVAIENARLYEEVRRNEERIEKELRFAQRVQAALLPTELDSWVAVLPDGSVSAFFGKMDMGQSLEIAIAQIVAEELDVALDKVQVYMGDSGTSCNQGGASGSFGVSHGSRPLRNAACEARRLLVDAAAMKLGVQASTLRVDDGVVSTRDGSKRTKIGRAHV